MRIAVAQINTSVGDFANNKSKIFAGISFAAMEKADMLVFPECTTTGYPQKDLLYNSAFIDENIKLVREVCQYSISHRNLTIIIGFVDKNNLTQELFNSAAVIENGSIIGTYRKHLLPNYTVFDERRYFTPGTEYPVFIKNGLKYAVTICEDAWDDTYKVKPFSTFKKQNADLGLFINLSASPFSVGKEKCRQTVLTRRSKDTGGIPILYVNQVGAQDSLIFDGNSSICLDNACVRICKSFKEDFVAIDFNNYFTATVKAPEKCNDFPYVEEHDIFYALSLGIKDYFLKTGFKKAVIGLSGGIDSAVVCAIAVNALGPDNVTGILMPSPYSSAHSVTDALKLAKNLGIKTHTVKIGQALAAYNSTFKTITKKYKSDITEQNFQARIRGNILMGFSNENTDTMVLSTGNKSEMSVGYCTLYGDMAGGLSIIPDVYKTQVFRLAKFINMWGLDRCLNSAHNRNKEVIPENTIKKPPSAELKPGQQDTDSLPPYDVLDAILIRYIEDKESYEEIVRDIPDEKLVKRVIRMVNINEFKRQQAAPGLIITERDLTVGRRMPIANRF